MKKLILCLTIPFILLFSSCIQTPEPDLPKRINYNFMVEKVGDTLRAGQDLISVTEIKLLVDKFELVVHDNSLLQSESNAIVMGYREEKNDEDELVLSAPIGYEGIERFKGLNLFIAPVNDNDNIQDNDFFGSSSNYSIVMKGTYNSRSFTYTSDFTFEKMFTFNEVILTKSQETLVLRFLLDVENIFIDQSSSGVRDPFNDDNRPAIHSMIEESLELEAYAANRIF